MSSEISETAKRLAWDLAVDLGLTDHETHGEDLACIESHIQGAMNKGEKSS